LGAAVIFWPRCSGQAVGFEDLHRNRVGDDAFSRHEGLQVGDDLGALGG
jgi:hypothetical protein